MIINKEFILASSSKSRFKILKQNMLKFKQIKPSCDEEKIKEKLLKKNTKPMRVVKELSKQKAMSVSTKIPNKITVGCDTIILLNKEIVQKAKNTKGAQNKLLKLSGKKHKIISSVSVYKNKTKMWEHTQTTTVEIRKLSKKQIQNYLRFCGKEILNSVGCYQIEAAGPMVIKKIYGDFFNVMGFPLFPFLNFLKKQNTKKTT